MKLQPFTGESHYPEYFYVGYVMQTNGCEYYHQALIDQRTKRSCFVQSAIAEKREGYIVGCMKLQPLDQAISVEFWDMFRKGISEKTSIEKLCFETQPELAEHMLRHYPGLVRTAYRSNIEGLVVLEYNVERKMSKKQLRSIGGGIVSVIVAVILQQGFGFGDLAICGLFVGTGLMGLGANIAYGLGTYSANMSPDVKTNAS